MSYVSATIVQKISGEIETSLNQSIALANQVSKSLSQLITVTSQPTAILSQLIAYTNPVESALVQSWPQLAGVTAALVQRWSQLDTVVQAALVQRWSQQNKNFAEKALRQLIQTEADTVFQQLNLVVIVGGVVLSSVVSCNLAQGYANMVELVIADQTEALTPADGDAVEVWWAGEKYELFLETRPLDRQFGQGSASTLYRLRCPSLSIQLDYPDALPVTKTWPADTLASEVLTDLCYQICDFDLQVDDFPIRELTAEAAAPIEILRQIFPEAYRLSTTPAGVLKIAHFFSVSPELIASAEPDHVLEYTSLAKNPEDIRLYNQVTVANQNQQTTSGYQLVLVDNGNGTGIAYGYCVPWQPDFELVDTVDTGVDIVGGQIEEVAVGPDEVEFTAGAGRLSKPIYGNLDLTWIDFDLSPVTFTEEGALTAAGGAGYSVAKVSYTTRRRVWSYSSSRDLAQLKLQDI